MILLGSTGSIGTQAIDIALKNNIEIELLCAGENIELLNRQIALVNPKIIVIKNENDKNKVIKLQNQKLFFGESGIIEALNIANTKLVLNALVGFSGVIPSLEAKKLGKLLALANKESLVVAGFLMDCKDIIPVDSEHFALKELLKNRTNIKELIITASGGAFRDTPLEIIESKTPLEALQHPNWSMGKKITIDSATMVNKLFEVLEAKYLFNTNNIDAMIERNSIIHALIQTKDNNVFANFSNSDMKLPISYAMLGKKAQLTPSIEGLDITKYIFKLERICSIRYPLWDLKNDLLKSPKLGIILNSANEILVSRFLNNHINFGEIAKGIFRAFDKFSSDIEKIKNINDILEFDREIKNFYSS
ncbi:1-deoxy-D-xylulose-5-phosphate reductoisomerase [Helicobacter sp. MIT 14-3879]|uniref:1-deoxy-D-xylulose-5-phosphate reductoisomerase n=1 Tax=Helicobacter sp. MIT 14-3879 TaxID=2040649 RepID=UPI000E1F756F|nr:1-deoxy-D-xylulose-5-phosphate reductoisomerase [Helicobacter sp. MIT 14-3879]RDU63988.1 1-deoxy-D-xylulose-5-phosphate reductoisomerase [Helicobacter sp. MIT 14-3879]